MTPEVIALFYAADMIGATLNLVDPRYSVEGIHEYIEEVDSHLLVCLNVVYERCRQAAKRTNVEKVIVLSPADSLPPVMAVGYRLTTPDKNKYASNAIRWKQFIANGKNQSTAAEPYDPDHACVVVHTGGTTGSPKGVMLTHYNVVNNGKAIGDCMDLSTADRMMIQVPMFHCFGMVLAMTASMTHGTMMSPITAFSPRKGLKCINEKQITAFHGVPTMFIAMLEHPDFATTDFSCMRTGIMAGSPCPISVMQDVVDRMHMTEITIVYGQTEASPGCTMSSTDDPLEVRVGTVGRPLPEIECRIVDPETGVELPDGAIGEFVARGYNIMKGYYKMPRATQAAIDRDGWLHTGDLACRTSEGNFRITGRLKDMIIRGGENIYPKEIEDFIYTHPKVKDVQVIGVPSKAYGEEIMACIILKEGETATEDEIRAFVRANMAKHKVPRYIAFTDAFPTNAAGKILKYKMREDAIEQLKLQKAAGVVTA